MTREYVDFTRTHEAYWDHAGDIHHRLRQPHAEARRRYQLAIVRDAVLAFLAIVVVVAAAAIGFAP